MKKKDRIKEKKVFTPVKFIILLTLLTIVISAIMSMFNFQTTNTSIIPELGELQTTVVTVNSLFTLEGLQYMLGNIMANFIGFAPLGTLLVALIGIGVMEKTGLIDVVCTLIGKKISRKLLTFLTVLVGILATVLVDSAYVFLIPLSAFMYLINGRNPITGITATFVSIATGYGINFIFSIYDPTLNSISTVAAALIDAEYILNIWGSVIFLLVATILLSILITEITERVVVPKIGRSHAEETKEEISIGKKEIRGLILAIGMLIICFLVVLYGIFPGDLPGAGFLLDMSKYNYVHKLFGATSTFSKSFPFILSTIFVLAGLAYGLGARTLKKLPNVIEHSISDIGYGIVLIFFTAQFIAIFKYSNIGTFIVNFLIDIIKNIQITGMPLILLFMVIVMVSNLFVTSPFTKWTIMAPVMVPMFMRAGMTPEFAQIIFRASSSVTSILTPMLAYFVVYIIFLQKYSKEELSVKKIYSLIWPYSLFSLALWLIVILGWYIIGIPVGINILPILK